MLKILQIIVLVILGVAVACFSSWRYFRGGDWWITAADLFFQGPVTVAEAFYLYVDGDTRNSVAQPKAMETA